MCSQNYAALFSQPHYIGAFTQVCQLRESIQMFLSHHPAQCASLIDALRLNGLGTERLAAWLALALSPINYENRIYVVDLA